MEKSPRSEGRPMPDPGLVRDAINRNIVQPADSECRIWVGPFCPVRRIPVITVPGDPRLIEVKRWLRYGLDKPDHEHYLHYSTTCGTGTRRCVTPQHNVISKRIPWQTVNETRARYRAEQRAARAARAASKRPQR